MLSSFGSESEHSLSWYALCVRLGFERVASQALGNKGYEQFLPLYPSARRWSDRAKQIHLPLFPGYLFCRLNVQERLLPVLTTSGVISILGSGPAPSAVPEIEISGRSSLTALGATRSLPRRRRQSAHRTRPSQGFSKALSLAPRTRMRKNNAGWLSRYRCYKDQLPLRFSGNGFVPSRLATISARVNCHRTITTVIPFSATRPDLPDQAPRLAKGNR
jgi:hypothetical protein